MAKIIRTILLFLQFILIKIGMAEIWLLKLPLTICTTIVGHLTKGRRGRPRKTAFFPYHANRLRLFFKRRVSLRTKITFAASIIILIIFLYTSFVFAAAQQLPSPEKLITVNNALTTQIFDRNGLLLYRLYEGRNRSLVKLEDLPPYVAWATIATEDKNFYSHIGFDLAAIIRATYRNLTKDTKEGASTITQQLIKNILLTPEQTFERKVREMILAFWAERIYSKNEILQMYLNEAPYGGPAWGIEAASQTYFAKSARNLSLAQAAFLAGLPASPTRYSPYGTSPDSGLLRQREVLQRMVKNKFITSEDAEAAAKEDLNLKPQSNNIKAPHFVMYVRDLLSQKYGTRAVSQGGLKIITTLDLNLQESIEEIVRSEAQNLAGLNVGNAAAMVTDGQTSQILAMVGSKNYHEPKFGNFNVTLALRQPGSSIKVATYATAFKFGYSPGNTVLDTPVVFRDEWGNSYSPVNYDNSYHGPVSIRTALGSSYNIPAVKILATVGVPEVINTARDMGITTFTDPKRYGLSLTLGGGEVTMVDMMTVYGTLSQLGQKRGSTPILKVTDSLGNVLEEFENRPTQAITPEIAYLITDILADNKARTPSFGENSLLKIGGYTLAVKTGTSDNKRDNWTFGYTPEFVVGSWVGNNDNTPMHPRLTSGVTGATPIWNKIMTLLLKDKPNIAFERPAGVIEVRVDGRRDLAIADKLPKSLVRRQEGQNKTIFSDPFGSFATSSAVLNLKPPTP